MMFFLVLKNPLLSRFFEYGRAVWILQKNRLQRPSEGFSWKFMSFWNPETGVKLSEDARDFIAGAVHSVWPSSHRFGKNASKH